MARNSSSVKILPGVPSENGILRLLKEPEDNYQIAVTVFNDQDEPIIPDAAILVAKVLPRGSNILLEGDKNLDLSTGEFYRPFNVDAEKFEFLLVDCCPEVAYARVTLSVIR